MSNKKQKFLNELSSMNMELYELRTARRMFQAAIDEQIKFTESSPEYVEEGRVTYKKALISAATRDYRRGLDNVLEDREILRTDMFIMKERVKAL